MQSLGRAFSILEEIARHREGIGLADLSKRVGLHNSTTFHLAKTMVSLGYIRQERDTKRYRVGRPLFALAAQRGAADGNALAENRAALRVLTFYANDRPLGLLLPDAYDWPRPRPMSVTLRQREDLALHFLISAVISAEAGSPLADTVGLWKELSDARQGGSGFSFDDLAADRAGTRLGERAVRDPAALQARLAAGLTDADLLPPIGDLPTQLSEKQFARRFGAVGSAAYNRVLADIEARIDALPLLR